MFEHLLPCHCYATKTNSRTISQQVPQFASAGKGADMSELQSHHCMFKQINHMGVAVHGHPQLSLKWRLPNRIRFDVFDRCFCKVETRACETLRSCAQHLGAARSRLCPGTRVHSIRPWLTPPVQNGHVFHSLLLFIFLRCCATLLLTAANKSIQIMISIDMNECCGPVDLCRMHKRWT